MTSEICEGHASEVCVERPLSGHCPGSPPGPSPTWAYRITLGGCLEDAGPQNRLIAKLAGFTLSFLLTKTLFRPGAMSVHVLIIFG